MKFTSLKKKTLKFKIRTTVLKIKPKRKTSKEMFDVKVAKRLEIRIERKPKFEMQLKEHNKKT